MQEITQMSEDQFAEIDYKLKTGEFEISLSSPVFAETLAKAEAQIRKCTRKIELDEFEAGSITIKIDIIGELLENPDVYSMEEGAVTMRQYKAPHIKSTSTLTLKKVEKEKTDKMFDMHEFKSKGNKIIAIPVSTAQMTIEEVGE